MRMESLSYKVKISETFENIRRFSFEEKKGAAFDEIEINKLLDEILEFKRVFSDKTNRVNAIVEKVDEITWFNNLENNSLMLINDLISAIRDLYSSLLRQYISLNLIRSKGIAKEEIRIFKGSIDDLKDIATDLESRFFFLPNMPDFKETTKELSLV